MDNEPENKPAVVAETALDKPTLKVRGIFKSPSLGIAFRPAGATGEGSLEMTDAGLHVVGTFRKPGKKFYMGLLGALIGILGGTIISFSIASWVPGAVSGALGWIFFVLGLAGGIYLGRTGKPQPLDTTIPWVKLEDTHFDGTAYSFRTWVRPRGTYRLEVVTDDKKLAGDLVKVTLKRRFA